MPDASKYKSTTKYTIQQLEVDELEVKHIRITGGHGSIEIHALEDGVGIWLERGGRNRIGIFSVGNQTGLGIIGREGCIILGAERHGEPFIQIGTPDNWERVTLSDLRRLITPEPYIVSDLACQGITAPAFAQEAVSVLFV
jgi:hypothetical protein